MEAQVDDADVELVSRYRWSTVRARTGLTAYARARAPIGDADLPGGSFVYMHRLIMGARPNESVDHVNGNGLDNRRANLRLASASQNAANRRKPRSARTSQFKGVHLDRGQGRKHWHARLKMNGTVYLCKRFATEEEAARAYDEMAERVHGAFARTNSNKGRQK